MSYELDSCRKIKCPCGKGYIEQRSYINDWFQTKSEESIDCKECREKYHIEHVYIDYKKHNDILYLVPIGESLYRNNCYNEYDTPFAEQLCMNYQKSDLEKIYIVLCENTNSSKIKDVTTKRVIKHCKSVNGTVRIKVIKESVKEAIHIYDEININYDKETVRINKVEDRSIRLYI